MSDIPSLPPVESAGPAPQPTSAWRRPSVIIAAVAVALLGWQWVETRSRLADLQEDLARRLADGDTAAKEARADGIGTVVDEKNIDGGTDDADARAGDMEIVTDPEMTSAISAVADARAASGNQRKFVPMLTSASPAVAEADASDVATTIDR